MGVLVFILAFMLWYPPFIDATGWRWDEFITIDSLVARIIGSLIISLALWLLYLIGFWLLLRKTAGSKREYKKDRSTVVGLIVYGVNFYVLPKVLRGINFAWGRFTISS